jgi:hypothetical protein
LYVGNLTGFTGMAIDYEFYILLYDREKIVVN